MFVDFYFIICTVIGVCILSCIRLHCQAWFILVIFILHLCFPVVFKPHHNFLSVSYRTLFAYVRSSSCPFPTLFTQRDISQSRDCSWQEVKAFPALGTGTCTLTFGDIITLPIRSLLSFVRPDELIRVSTWDGELGQAGPHLGPR